MPGGYTAHLTVYEKENANYDYIYDKFAEGKWVTPTKENNEHQGIKLPEKAKVVCVNRVTTKGLKDSGSNSEINISLNSSNFMNVFSDSWPASANDCKVIGDYDANGIYLDTCEIANEGGAVDINGLCTLLMDSDYNLGLDIIEADTSSYELSSKTFANNLFPKAKTPSYNMRVFVPQKANAPATKTTETCWEVSTGITGKYGFKAKGEVRSKKIELDVGG